MTHLQEAFMDSSITPVLSTALSAQPSQQRPVCRGIYLSFLHGDIILQSPDLGYTEWNTTPATSKDKYSLFLYLSYSKLPVIESCSPGLPDMNGAA